MDSARLRDCDRRDEGRPEGSRRKKERRCVFDSGDGHARAHPGIPEVECRGHAREKLADAGVRREAAAGERVDGSRRLSQHAARRRFHYGSLRRPMRALLLVLMCSVTLAAQQPAPAIVTNQDLLAGLTPDVPKWRLYHGNYFGHRFSPLTQITPQHVNQLKAQWTFQTRLTPDFQPTQLLIDNVLYVTGFNGTAWAIEARSRRQICD